MEVLGQPGPQQHALRHPCAERQRLLDQARTAIGTIMSIHNEEMEAVIRGEMTDQGAIERRLHEARRLKTFLIEQLKGHVEEHGC